tara:strand:- start:309 stop:761 length:453 start_codon:yes stop_codon:yes gene_type:complete
MRIFFIFIFFLSKLSYAEIVNPNPNILPLEVIEIQLNALKTNNFPYDNAGIEQTFNFAHPENKKYTGPLEKFTNMMYTEGYDAMINHQDYKIIFLSKNKDTAYYFIELTDQFGNLFGFEWIVKKVLKDDKFKNCWMTISVSQPINLAQST